MTKEYLDSLRKILEDNNYEDSDSIIEYYSELIEDRKEAGEKEEDIINTLQNPEAIAKDLLGDIKVNIKDSENYVGGDISSIKAKLLCADLSVTVDNSLSEVKIDYPDDERISVEQVNDTLSIREFKSNKLTNDNLSISITLPSNYKLNQIDIGGSSCDVSVVGVNVADLALFTASGDLNAANLKGDKAYIGTVSGDLSLKDITFDKMDVNSVSGDQMFDGVKTPKLKGNSVSGDLEANNIEINKFDFNSISGDSEIKNSVIDELSLESISGDIDVKLNGNYKDYKVEVRTMWKKHKQGFGDKTLTLKSKTGDINYDIN